MDDVALLRLLALSTSALVFIPKIAIANDLQEKKLRIVHEFKDIKKFYYAITRQIKFPNPICESLIKAIRKE